MIIDYHLLASAVKAIQKGLLPFAADSSNPGPHFPEKLTE
jgi:hypothetical protein